MPRKTDLCALLALLLGLVGFVFLSCVFGPAALILGGVSLTRLNENPALQGRWMAVMGAVLGGIELVITVVNFDQLARELQRLGGQ